MTLVPLCNPHISRTCAVDLPLASAIFLSVWSFASGLFVDPKQEYAVAWMPFSLQYSNSFGEGQFGCNSIWFTAGTVLQLGSLSNFSRFLMPKFDTPISVVNLFSASQLHVRRRDMLYSLFTLPLAGSFCISAHVFTKSQSGKCFFLSLGSVELGQCIRYKSTYPVPKLFNELSIPSSTT